MKTYLCIDTNIFIQCCLLQIEGDDINALKSLKEVLDADSVTLLLPEVVQIEFEKKLPKTIIDLEAQMALMKEYIARNSGMGKKVIHELCQKMDSIVENRKDNTDNVRNEISEIFSHKNTKKIPLTSKIILEATRHVLMAKKPSNDQNWVINADVLLINSVKDYLKKETDYNLYFVSSNYKDFSNSEKDSSTDTVLLIHNDIGKMFHHIEYYRLLLKLLTDKFGKTYTSEDITKEEQKFKITESQTSTTSDLLNPATDVSEIISTLSSQFSLDSISSDTTSILGNTTDNLAGDSLK